MNQDLKQKSINGVVWSSIERFSVQGINFLLGLVVARLLTPDDYGVIAMLTIFLAVSHTFIDCGFSPALIRKPDRTEADNSTVFYFNIVIGALIYLLLFLSAPLIARFYHLPLLTQVTRVVGIVLLFNSLCVVQQALLTARIDFKTQAKVSVSAALLSGTAGICMAYCDFGVWALVTQIITAALLQTVLLWYFVKWKPTKAFSIASFKELFGFGSKLLASGLLNTAYNNIYSLVIGKKFDSFALGNYTRANQFAIFPSQNLTSILQRVTFPILSSIQDDKERLRRAYYTILCLSGFIIFPLMVGLAVVAKPLVLLLLTDKWIDSVALLQIVCFALMWYPIHAINLNLLQVVGRSDLFLKLEVIKKVIGIGILCLSLPFGLKIMCWGIVLSSVISLVINMYYTDKLIQIGFRKQLGALLPILFCSFTMGGCTWLTTQLFSSFYWQLIAGTVVGAISYYLLSLLTRSPEMAIIKNLLIRKRI